jgi:hypothetical protein
MLYPTISSVLLTQILDNSPIDLLLLPGAVNDQPGGHQEATASRLVLDGRDESEGEGECKWICGKQAMLRPAVLCCRTVLPYCAAVLCCRTVLPYCAAVLCCRTVMKSADFVCICKGVKTIDDSRKRIGDNKYRSVDGVCMLL